MTDLKTIVVTELDHIAHIKLHRPELRNSFNAEMISELTEVFNVLESRTDLQAVTITGEGKAFCAGADLNWMKSMVKFSNSENKADAIKLYNMFEAQKNLTLPIIGLVHGAAFGGALGLLANCDYVIAEENTSFCFSEVKLGISPAVISSFVLGKANSKINHLMLSGTIFNEVVAVETDLVNEVVKTGEGHLLLQKIIHQYKSCGPQAVRKTKRLINQIKNLEWNKHKELTTDLIAEIRTSTEGQEGLNSFLEKRKPNWQ